MRILVTGAAGYVGRPLVDRLVAAGHEVVGIDVVAAPRTVVGDIRTPLADWFTGTDAVVHLAAVSFAPEWDDADDLIHAVNVDGTRAVIEACERAGVPRLVFASSASVFESHTHPAATVETVPAPISAYARSKVAGEVLLAASSVPQRVVVRKGTLCGFGPRPRLDLLANAMAVSALRDGCVFVDGAGDAYRPVLRLDRAAATYEVAATRTQVPGMHACNVADDNVAVIDVARLVSRITGAEIVHREARGRCRSYRMVSGSTGNFVPPDDSLPGGAIVARVVREARARLMQLPRASGDPRLDRLASIRVGAVACS